MRPALLAILLAATVVTPSCNDSGKSPGTEGAAGGPSASAPQSEETNTGGSGADLVTVRPQAIDDILYNPGFGFADFHNSQFVGGGILPTSEYPRTTTTYFRWYWGEMEPQKGEINFQLIENAIVEGMARGNSRAAFRFIMPWGGRPSAKVPAWLAQEVGYDGWTSPEGNFLPNHDNPAFLANYERVIRAIGARYNGDPRIDHIDLSAGCWGEWNNACAPNARLPSEETRRRIVDVYKESFPDTPLTVPYGIGRSTGAYAAEHHIGWRSDCFGKSDWNQDEDSVLYNNSSDAIRNVWKYAPVELEVCYTFADWGSWYDVTGDFQYARDVHASVINGKNVEVLPNQRPVVDQFLRDEGYRFVLTELTHESSVVRSEPLHLTQSWRNTGTTPTYHPYQLRYRLRNEGHSLEWDSLVIDTAALPGAFERRDSFVIPSNAVPGTYTLEVALLDLTYPDRAYDTQRSRKISLGIAGREGDGWYPLSEVTIN